MKKNSILLVWALLIFSAFASAENTLKLDLVTQKGKGSVL
ncbi:MAG: hypothetical protein ACJAUP_003712, partial [Cellvibrionaceae bacterium]